MSGCLYAACLGPYLVAGTGAEMSAADRCAGELVSSSADIHKRYQHNVRFRANFPSFHCVCS